MAELARDKGLARGNNGLCDPEPDGIRVACERNCEPCDVEARTSRLCRPMLVPYNELLATEASRLRVGVFESPESPKLSSNAVGRLRGGIT